MMIILFFFQLKTAYDVSACLVGCPKEDDEKGNDIDDEDAVALNLREWAFEQDADGKDDASGEDADADPVIAETLMEEDGKRYRQRS